MDHDPTNDEDIPSRRERRADGTSAGRHELRRARILAMQAISQWDVQHDESEPALSEFLAADDAPRRVVKSARTLVQAFWSHRDLVDKYIESASQRWSLARMNMVDRNVMRVAVTEWLSAGTPEHAVLDEAIEIAREYGGKDSHRFVNGILDRVLHVIRKEST